MLGGKLCDGKSIQIITCDNSSIDTCSEIMNNTIETNVSQAGIHMYIYVYYVCIPVLKL